MLAYQGTARALSANPDLFRQIFEFSPDAILILNQQGRITRVNGRTESLFGYTRNEVIGVEVEPLIPHLSSSEGLDRFARRKDGSEFPVDVMLNPVKTDEGTLVICVVRDVTQQNLTRAAQQLAATIASAEDAIFAKDLKGTVLSWNPGAERLFGWMEAEAVGRNIAFLIPEERQDEEPRIFAALLRGDSVDHFESVRLKKDGTRIDVALTISAVRDFRGLVVACSQVVRDITDRKRTREREILLREIHHRVKNNLAVISSLFFLQSTYTHDADTVRLLQESQDRVRSMALVHEALYRSDDFAAVDFAEYALTLASQLLQTYGLPTRHIHLTAHMKN